MLVNQTNPAGVELPSDINSSSCSKDLPHLFVKITKNLRPEKLNFNPKAIYNGADY